MQAFQDSQWLAGEMLAAAEGLGLEVRRFADEIKMGFLYEPQRRLFAVGFNVSEGRLDSAHYDLLASEARLGSFVAIAGGDVPTGAAQMASAVRAFLGIEFGLIGLVVGPAARAASEGTWRRSASVASLTSGPSEANSASDFSPRISTQRR